MLTAITTTENVVQNTHFKKVLAQAEKTVQKGEPLGEVFSKAEDLYPPLMGELIAVGEETGSLPAMLLQSAEYYENEVAQKTKNISTIIEPLLMVFVGIAVGFFALAMIAPIYSMSDAIK
jgi:type IV pilus assembly protein PilC